MLIPSPRHRPADLALWAELEEADRLHYEIGKVADKATKAVRDIQDFAKQGPCYAGISWGKDSMVVADLILRSGEPIPLVYLRAIPGGTPDASVVQEQSGLSVTVFDVEYNTIPRELSRDATEAEKDRRFFAAFRLAEKKFGRRHISGVRAEESVGRKIRMRRWDIASQNALAPIGWWSQQDVFAYHAVHAIATHPAYAMLGGGRYDRAKLRTDELGGDRGNQFGRREWEVEYYGDLLRRIEAQR